MRKKLLSFILLATLVLSLVGCGAINVSPLVSIEFQLEDNQNLVNFKTSKAVVGSSLADFLSEISAEKVGYTFSGWEIEGVGKVDESHSVEQGIVVVPTFIANEYQLTQVLNNGEENVINTVVYDSSVELETPVSADKYQTFKQWCVDEELTTPWDGTIPANDFTLYAEYAYINDSVILFYYQNELIYELPYNGSEGVDLSSVPSDFYAGDYEKPELLTVEWYTESGEWVENGYMPTSPIVKVYPSIYTNILRISEISSDSEEIEYRVLGQIGSASTEYSVVYIGNYMQGHKIVEVGNMQGLKNVVETVYIANEIKAIGNGAFENSANLKEVVFEEGSQLEIIENAAFSGCTSLTQVVLPSGLKYLGSPEYAVGTSGVYTNLPISDGVFAGCTSLSQITFPETLESVGSFAFANCASLSVVELPKELKTLGVAAFYNAFVESEEVISSLTIYGSEKLFYAVDVAKGSEYFENHSNPLYNCNVNEIYFYGVTSIPGISGFAVGSASPSPTNPLEFDLPKESDAANIYNKTLSGDAYPFFMECNKLEKVVFDNAIESIGSYAFYGRTNVAVEIPADVMEVSYGEGVFAHTVYDEFTLPDNMYHIPAYAFANSTIIRFSNVVPMFESIGSYAFWNCANLAEFTINSYVTNIDSTAFKDTPNLASADAFTIDNENFYIQSYDDVPSLLIGNGGSTILYDFNINVAVKSFPEGVTVIPALYSNNTTITTVYIPSTVKTIEANAFFKCTSLTTIIYAKNSQLESIQAGAFSNCSKLTVAYYEGSEDTTSFIIPKSVKVLGLSVEQLEAYKANDNYIELYTKENNTVADGVFTQVPSTRVVFEEGSQIEFIGSYSFYRVNAVLEEVVFPTSIEADGLVICDQAFANKASTATNFVVPEYVTYLGTKVANNWGGFVFPEAANLTVVNGFLQGINNTSLDLVIPAYVVEIKENAFMGTKVKSISFEENSELKVLGQLATSSTGVTVTTVDLSNCHNLESVANNVFKYTKATQITFNSSMLKEGVIQVAEGQEASFGGSNFGNTNLKVTINASEENGSVVEYSLSTLFKSASKMIALSLAEGLVSIGNDGFKSATKLTSLELPSTLQEIGTNLFNGCTALTKVTLNSNVELKEGMFDGCTKLTSFNIPEGTKEIPNYMFDGCISLTSISLPNTVEVIGHFAFHGCTKLATINWPTSLVKIGDRAFFKCTALAGKTISLPSTLQEIGVYGLNISGSTSAAAVKTAKVVFANEGGVEALTLGQGALYNMNFEDENGFSIYTSAYTTNALSKTTVDYSGDYGYAEYVETVLTYYTGKADVVVPEGVTKVDVNAFTGASITSVVFPASLEVIAKGSSGNPTMKSKDSTSKLTSVKFAEGRTSESSLEILDYAFYDMPIAELVLPTEGKVVIGSNAFAAKSASPETAMTLTDLVISGNVEFTGTNQFRYQKNIKSVVVSEGVTALPNYVFDGATGLTTVSLPEGLKTLGTYAFNGATSLTSIKLPSTLESIDSYAFAKTAITELVIPASVKTLASNMVNGCTKLTTVVIGTPEEGTALTQIPSTCFKGATALTSVTIYGTDFVKHQGTSKTNSAFNGIAAGKVTVYVDASVLATYESDKNWSTYGNCSFAAISEEE